ncbi:mechanosensitive ion channel domain-containing protein [Chitinimonas sp. BJB300]|uniref:mechanosensitive ion channel domain-containing protein n=1 Tax=Chitinimonas sp. BJB300 TaxID=1559339 RepID=UPI000C101DD5|nr:mechanosensitive ion channel domain-containing protein [Chitinimonas sp. BJB300]PHV12964.1 mechanosensitive ion channel protein MscS [Chitinimonas sp. BJB300]TSJ89083.1 mechanosensitive ion channel [Chitinimonas sp. BJB300]
MPSALPLQAYLSDRTTLADGLASLALLLTLLVIRYSLGKLITHNPNFTLEQRRRWQVTLRNSLIAAFIIGLVVVWASELHALLVSLAAFAVALVVAGKEIILCLSGSMLRSGGQLYVVGDRIQIGEHRGSVVDTNLFSTTLIEDDPESHQRTGRAIAIPNSLLWSHAVVRDSLMGDFIMHQFSVPIACGQDWRGAEARLLELAREACASCKVAMMASAREMAERHALEIPVAEPLVTLQLKEADKLVLIVHVPAEANRRHNAEQHILRGYLAVEIP